MLNLNCKKRGYFKDFLLGGYFLIALFIAAITVTALYSAYEFDLFGKILAKENFVYFMCGSFGLIFFLILAYVYSNAAKKSVTLADSISCAMIIVAILYAVYIVLKGYNDVLSIAVPSALFVLGLVAFIISVIKYDKNAACVSKSDYTFKGPFGYVKAVFSKFSALGVALVASIIAICFYLCINDGVRTIFLNLAEEFFAVYVISAAALILFVIFLIGGLFNKKINHADLALVSIFFSLIISFLQFAIVLYFMT